MDEHLANRRCARACVRADAATQVAPAMPDDLKSLSLPRLGTRGLALLVRALEHPPLGPWLVARLKRDAAISTTHKAQNIFDRIHIGSGNFSRTF